MLKLAAEKNLNKFGFPAFNLKGRKIDYPIRFEYSDYHCDLCQGQLKANNLMMLDILGTIIIQVIVNRGKEVTFFNNMIRSERNDKVKFLSSYHIGKAEAYSLLQYMYDEKIEIIPNGICRSDTVDIPDEAGKPRKEIEFSIADSLLRKALPILNKYSSKQLHDLLLDTSQVKVRMKYPMRFYDQRSKKYIIFIFNNYQCESSFFRIVNVENSKLAQNGNVLVRQYSLRFDTILGYIFAQNNLSAYVDLLPLKFYEMSDYAQLFHRILILPYYKDVKSNLTLQQIAQRLGLKTTDTSMRRKIINRILDELESNTFIKEPKENRKDGFYYYSYPKNKWKEIEK